jgi:hypothetical protein
MQNCIGHDGKSSIHEEFIDHKLSLILAETQENTLAHHWKIAEDNYPIHYFIRDLNKGSLN